MDHWIRSSNRWKGRGTRLVLLVLIAVAPGLAGGAEIRLRSQCRPSGAVVTLGQVADVLAADKAVAQQLEGIELFPSPAPGTRRFLGFRELQDLLLLRGVSLMDHRFSGAHQVIVLAPEPGRTSESPDPASSTRRARAEALVASRIQSYLRDQLPDGEVPEVTVRLSDTQVDAVSECRRLLAVAGGGPPWTGRQRFTLSGRGAAGPVAVVVDAQVSRPVAVAVAAVALPRGTLIRPGDLRLEDRQSPSPHEQPIRSLEELLGKETVRSIPAGRAVGPDDVRAPRLVRRGDAITVRARVAGVRVTTTAVAREDGSQGDRIAVESPDRRRRYTVRVTASGEAEAIIPAADHNTRRVSMADTKTTKP